MSQQHFHTSPGNADDGGATAPVGLSGSSHLTSRPSAGGSVDLEEHGLGAFARAEAMDFSVVFSVVLHQWFSAVGKGGHRFLKKLFFLCDNSPRKIARGDNGQASRRNR